jgi:alpha,alpha-trehalase
MLVAALLAVAALGSSHAFEEHAERGHRTVTPPSELYGELFVDVQMQRVFADGKTFVDAVAKQPPRWIVDAYRREKNTGGFSLAQFVRSHFELPSEPGGGFQPDPSRPIGAHIEALWPYLTRPPDEEPAWRDRTSLLPLPNAYVVPGGRFREVYYWDSYFTMLGLIEGGHQELAEHMVKNFANLIDRYGRIPNGNRSYYLSRSQPPFFFTMVGLLGPLASAASYARYLPHLQKEYAFWMEGEWRVGPGEAHRRVVAMPDGTVLNRYWDDRDTPRDESYRQDVMTARERGRSDDDDGGGRGQVYRDLRAAAESGWDFSTRWFADGRTLATIETTSIIPIDLNSLLYGLELAIRDGCRALRDRRCQHAFEARAGRRRLAVNRYLWDDAAGHYADYHWVDGVRTDRLSAATVYPLFVGMADTRRAARVAERIASDLLYPHGIVTTLVRSGQQWDLPNGWAPLQWLTVEGLNRYHHTDLAREVASRWMRNVESVYRDTVKLVEKYDVTTRQPGGGGEYPTQDGFGWTNGVMIKLIAIYPDVLQPVMDGAPTAAPPTGPP